MTASDQPPSETKDEFLKKLGGQMASSDEPDFTIIYKGDEYRFQECRLVIRSLFWKETLSDVPEEYTCLTVGLSNYPKVATQALVQFLRTSDYTFYEAEINALTVDALPVSPVRNPQTALEAHASVYTLAYMIGINELLAVAEGKFAGEAKRLVLDLHSSTAFDDFFAVIPFLYTEPGWDYKALRTAVIDAWRLKPRALAAAMTEKLLRELIEKFPDLGVDLFFAVLGNEEDERKQRLAAEARLRMVGGGGGA